MDDSVLISEEGGGAEDASYSLIDEMKGCQSMLDIIEVVQEEAADMSPAEVSLALYRVAYLSRSARREGALSLVSVLYLSLVQPVAPQSPAKL